MSKHVLIEKIIQAAEALEKGHPPFGTTASIIAALGGQAAVVQLTGANPSAVANWNSEPHFPARFYAVMLDALHDRGFHAPPRFWGQHVGGPGGDVAKTAPEAA